MKNRNAGILDEREKERAIEEKFHTDPFSKIEEQAAAIALIHSEQRRQRR